MKVAFLQIPLHWESPEENRKSIEIYLEKADLGGVDVLLLPETFTTGFSMKAVHLAEPIDGQTIQWLRETSAKYDISIAGSLMIKEGERVFNRFVWVDEHGVHAEYNKKHLFGLGAEKELITAGEERSVFSYKNWAINLQICYDLRFPVWMRNQDGDTDLILLVANWPSARSEAWRSLLVARAIENQCYVLGVNRVGTDGNGLSYNGDSMLVGPAGEIITDAKDEVGVFSALLDKKSMYSFRDKFPFLNDADRFAIK